MTSVNYVYPSRILTRTSADDRVFTEDEDGTRTYGDLAVAANGWKLAFERARARRVALCFTDLFEAAAALLGAWAAHVVTVLPSDTTPMTCERLIQSRVDACAGSFSADCGMLRLLPVATDAPCRDAFDEDEPLIELFTSGTTDLPTLVVKRLKQLFSEVEAIERHAQNRTPENAIIVSTVSPQHIYGLVFFLLWPMASARSIWNRLVTKEEELLDVAVAHSHVVWVGSTLLMNQEPQSHRWPLAHDHWSTIVCSGSSLADEAVRRLTHLTGVSPVEVFGSSEAGGIAGRIRTIEPNGALSSETWIPASDVQWRIDNGLLFIKGPRLLTDDWVSMNDRAEPSSDGQGFIYLGRADRIADLDGRKISLTAMEEVLAPNAFVKEARAFVLHDERHSLAVVASLTEKGLQLLHREGKNFLSLKLCNLLADTFDSACLPQRWRFVNDMPRDSVGKVSIASLVELFEPAYRQAVLVSRDESHAVFSVTLPANSPFFKLRTKVYIIPGLQQIQLSMTLARSVFPIPAAFTGLSDMSFPLPVPADTTFDVELTHCPEENAVRFVWRDKEKVFAQGRILFNQI